MIAFSTALIGLLMGHIGWTVQIWTNNLEGIWLTVAILGGVFAGANLRGGGEYGKRWHEARQKLNKQNVFDDFIAAADWLVK